MAPPCAPCGKVGPDPAQGFCSGGGISPITRGGTRTDGRTDPRAPALPIGSQQPHDTPLTPLPTPLRPPPTPLTPPPTPPRPPPQGCTGTPPPCCCGSRVGPETPGTEWGVGRGGSRGARPAQPAPGIPPGLSPTPGWGGEASPPPLHPPSPGTATPRCTPNPGTPHEWVPPPPGCTLHASGTPQHPPHGPPSPPPGLQHRGAGAGDAEPHSSVIVLDCWRGVRGDGGARVLRGAPGGVVAWGRSRPPSAPGSPGPAPVCSGRAIKG